MLALMDVTQIIEQITKSIASDTALLSSPDCHPRDERIAIGRIQALNNYRESLASPITMFDTDDNQLIKAVRALDTITSQGEPTREPHPDYGDIYNDTRVEGTRFEFLGAGMHRLAYLDTVTGRVIKRLHDFGDDLLEDAFWAEEKQSLALFSKNAEEHLAMYDIRYAETLYHTLPDGRSYMIQEHFDLDDSWLDGHLFLTRPQEQFFALESTGISNDLCTLNCAQEGTTLVLFDMLEITYDAYMHVSD